VWVVDELPACEAIDEFDVRVDVVGPA
jgi:hypothetical protein